jgi:hypothetical protein
MAGKLASDLVNAAAGSGDVKQAAQSAIAQATQLAKTDPHVAAALKLAQTHVAQATAGYHVAQTVANAAAGNPDAQAQIAQLSSSAAEGDPAAAALMDVASDITDASSANAIVQGVTSDLRARASSIAKGLHGTYLGVVLPGEHGKTSRAFASLDTADDWLAAVEAEGGFTYAAIYDATDPTWPAPISESLGDHAEAHISGVIGSSASLRSQASQKARTALASRGGSVVGVQFYSDGASGAVSFATLDDADDWLAQIGHGPGTVYAAIFDATDPTFPAPVSEAHGTGEHVSGVVLPMFLTGAAGFAAGAYFWPALKEKIAEWRGKKAA